MEVGVKVSAENPRSDEEFHTATAYLVMIALDDKSKPQKVMDVSPQSDDEKRRYHQAGERRTLRLAARRMMRT